MCRAAIAVILMFFGSVHAGPNQNAKLSIDFAPGTLSIDSLGACPMDSLITAAVRVEGASMLYGFEFYLKHDTASLRFISGEAGSDLLPAMLKKNGGSISFFTADPSRHDSTLISLGCSLRGDVASQCVSDSGLLCLLKFRHLKNDTTRISIKSTQLLDCDEIADTGLQCFSGTIVPSAGVAVARRYNFHRNAGPRIAVRNGTLDVDFGSATNYTVIAVNTLGKQVGSGRGIAGNFRFDCGPATGLTVVHVRWQGNEIAVPVLR